MKSTSRLTVRYAETDQMGIVHHSNYPIWYEVARTDYIKLIGLTYTQFEEMGLMTPLVSMESHFIQPAFYEDELRVEASLSQVSQVKLIFSYKVYREKDHTLINTGETVHGIVNKKRQPVRMKREFPELYQKLLNACED